jgi:hypothetical protein
VRSWQKCTILSPLLRNMVSNDTKGIYIFSSLERNGENSNVVYIHINTRHSPVWSEKHRENRRAWVLAEKNCVETCNVFKGKSKVGFSCCMLHVSFYLAYFPTLKMEATCSCETEINDVFRNVCILFYGSDLKYLKPTYMKRERERVLETKWSVLLDVTIIHLETDA